ncbi:MAG: hypothetical protein ABI591_32655 [Kofleriaceae bacterium]
MSEQTRAGLRWIAARTPRQILCAGWIVFAFGAYPGYLTREGVLQLYTVRSGDYSDYSPVMTAIWGALEYVVSGPFPMLALQSGLFLFGLQAVLARVVTPRAAALTATGVLMFPPVYSVMAVIWPDALMAGALLAGCAAALDHRRGWKIAGAVLIAIAVACRPEVKLALIPLAIVVVPPQVWWRRAAIAVGLALGLSVLAGFANWALVVVDTYTPQQLGYVDVTGTMRRTKLKKIEVLDAAFAGLPIVDHATFKAQLLAGSDAHSWWSLTHGDKRMFELIATDEQAAALAADRHAAITHHTKAYLVHRWAMTRALLEITGSGAQIVDDFGDFDLLAPLHHRASSSDWQRGWRIFVRWTAPVFRPWIWLVLAIAAIVLARRRPLLRALAISGVLYELVMWFLAPATEYRYSHWLITTACIALAALVVARKWAASR